MQSCVKESQKHFHYLLSERTRTYRCGCSKSPVGLQEDNKRHKLDIKTATCCRIATDTPSYCTSILSGLLIDSPRHQTDPDRDSKKSENDHAATNFKQGKLIFVFFCPTHLLRECED